MLGAFSYARLRRQDSTVDEELEKLKQRLPLLDYLRRQNWTARPAGHGSELVGLCPLHPETRPSFYVNASKNLFYCHGCGQGGDLLRFVQLSRHLSFRQSLAYLRQQSVPPADPAAVLEQAATFYQQQLGGYPEALHYLKQRGLRDSASIKRTADRLCPRRELAPSSHGARLFFRSPAASRSARRAATPFTGVSSSRAAKEGASSTSTATVSVPP